jgi:hypothetical protein
MNSVALDTQIVNESDLAEYWRKRAETAEAALAVRDWNMTEAQNERAAAVLAFADALRWNEALHLWIAPQDAGAAFKAFADTLR